MAFSSSISNAFAKKTFLSMVSKIRVGTLNVETWDGRSMLFQSSINGTDATLIINDDSFYSKVVFSGEIGFGEAYQEGLCDSPDLVKLLQLALENRQSVNLNKGFLKFMSTLRNLKLHKARANTIAQSKHNIHDHYDLGNDFFSLFLDESMTYSSAVFQNSNDCKTLSKVANLSPDKVIIIEGSGVDLSEYTRTPLPKGLPIVVMAARLLRDKGIYEFVEAAELLKNRGVKAQFWLAGDRDEGNPASVDINELEVWCKNKNVKLLGHREDIPHVFSQAKIVVLPSYYREGLPKVLIEAAACGRPVVTTDMPGCRDAINPEVSGILVPPRDTGTLADAIQRLLLDPKLCEQMGKSARQLAEQKFSIEKVVSTHMSIYNELLETSF